MSKTILRKPQTTCNSGNHDCFLGLLAVAAHKIPKSGSCLSSDVMDNLATHKLKGDERQTALLHINSCNKCYKRWFDSVSAIHDSTHITPLPRMPQWLHSINDYFTRLTRLINNYRWKLATPVAAGLVIGLLVFEVSTTDGIQDSLKIKTMVLDESKKELNNIMGLVAVYENRLINNTSSKQDTSPEKLLYDRHKTKIMLGRYISVITGEKKSLEILNKTDEALKKSIIMRSMQSGHTFEEGVKHV